MNWLKIVFTKYLLFLIVSVNFAQNHPKLVLTKAGLAEISRKVKEYPVFYRSLQETIAEVDLEITKGISIPTPSGMAGGESYERHKMNYLMLQKAGLLFQITTKQKYACYVRDMLMGYAKLYPSLPLHPERQSYARGKLFWQCLNDANWLVYVSQAYDCIYDWLGANERKILETKLFRPYADFLSIESPQFFNRIHNHSTWGIAAVGMIGLVMNDNELIDRALFGLKEDSTLVSKMDNDGGLINSPGMNGKGFYAQLDHLFSPDGYYAEGPYYQRYALCPIMLFAEALANCRPDLKIFDYRDHILSRSLYALLQLSDSKGRFFPINDSQKGMSTNSREIISAVDIIYHFGGHDPSLLSIAGLQGRVLLDDCGFSVAKDLKEKKEIPFRRKSIELKDGANGNQGAVGILRADSLQNEMSLVLKYTSQGMGHGHFDKLSFLFYDNGNEVFTDYGSARFVNIDQKAGGGYLAENSSWAKQTIAHNTVVRNETSHFNGKTDIGSNFHSDRYFFNASLPYIQVVSAKDTNAYPGTMMHRTMALLKDVAFEKPLLIDIFRIQSQQENKYDLPYHYTGQQMSTNFKYSIPEALSPLGKNFGYQHLWKTGEGKCENLNAKISWLSNNVFYSLTSLVSPDDQLIFSELGAKDPSANFVRDRSFIIRKNNQKQVVYLSVIESHGRYDAVDEVATNAFSSIYNLNLLVNNDFYTMITFSCKSGENWVLAISNNDAASDSKHEVSLKGKKYNWTGPFLLIKSKG